MKFALGVGLALVTGCGAGGTASPDTSTDGGNASADLSFHGQQGPFPGFSYDTGAQPPASPVTIDLQLSAAGTLTADAQAAAGGDPTNLTVAGIPGTGKYTLDVHFKVGGTLHAALTGVPSYDGPIPGIEDVDIAFGGSTTFDPFLIGKNAPVTANIPQTALPQIPLPGGIPGGLVITILTGSTMTSTFQGVCAGVVGTEASYTAQTSSSATLLLQAAIVIQTPLGDKSIDVPSFTVTVPSTVEPLDMGMAMASGGGPVPGGSSVAQQGACAPVADGGVVADGGGVDGGVEAGSPDSGVETTLDGGASGDAGADGGMTGGTCGDPFEPNDEMGAATALSDVQDSDAPVNLSASVFIGDDGADVDWYSYTGIDATNLTFTAQPSVTGAAADGSPLEVCVWAAEKDGSAITSGCQAGTPADDTSDFPTPSSYVGCCAVEDGSSPATAKVANYGRVLANDDSYVFMRVRDLASTMTCVQYGLTYSFGQ